MVIALQETTVWDNSSTPNHVYLLDGTNLVAYIRAGTKEPFYFKHPIKGFSRTGRKFVELKKNPFKEVESAASLRKVAGSRGNTYFVNDSEGTCTCPGYTFRGACKHVKAADA
jgi:hypothetical protein